MSARTSCAALACVLLAGCASTSPHADLHTVVANVIDAANSGSSIALTTAAGDLRFEVEREIGDHRLTEAQAAPLRRLAQKLIDDARFLPGPGAVAPSVTPATAAPPPTAEPTKRNKDKGGGNGNAGSGEGDPSPVPPSMTDGGQSPSPASGSPGDSPAPSGAPSLPGL